MCTHAVQDDLHHVTSAASEWVLHTFTLRCVIAGHPAQTRVTAVLGHKAKHVLHAACSAPPVREHPDMNCMSELLGSWGPVYKRAILAAVATLLLGTCCTSMSTRPVAVPNTLLHTWGSKGDTQPTRTDREMGRNHQYHSRCSLCRQTYHTNTNKWDHMQAPSTVAGKQ